MMPKLDKVNNQANQEKLLAFPAYDAETG